MMIIDAITTRVSSKLEDAGGVLLVTAQFEQHLGQRRLN
jgi:hypothetical protein